MQKKEGIFKKFGGKVFFVDTVKQITQRFVEVTVYETKSGIVTGKARVGVGGFAQIKHFDFNVAFQAAFENACNA